VAPEGKTEKSMQRVEKSPEIQGVFFDMWRQEHPDVDLEEVPADLVMASASGLDPHITMKNAHYQLDRVVKAWADKTGADPKHVRQQITRILEEKSESPLGGLVGLPLVNVLEVNLALAERLPRLARKAS
jgi:K+-transporting ATPase ATPase C chain